jgi:Tfp pilus assembly protein PilN
MDWKKEIKLSDLIRRGDSSGQEGSPEEQPAATQQTGPDGDNVWKKEIRLSSLFRRQKKVKQPALPGYGASTASAPADAPGQRPEPESVWKKEIKFSSLFRRKKTAARHREPLALPSVGQTIPEAPTAVDNEDARADTPEFTRVVPVPSADSGPAETEQAEQVAGDAQPAPADEPVAEEALAAADPGVDQDEPAAPAEAGEKTSVWKKQVGFGRKQKAAAAAAAAGAGSDAGADASAAVPKQSAWKKDIKFGRKAKAPRPDDAGPERREEREQPKPADRGPERKPKSGDKLPEVPLMRSLNLLPRDAQLAKTSTRPWLLQAAALGVSAVVLAGVGYLYLSARNDVADQEQALEEKQAELVALQAQLVPSASDDTALAGEALSRATALSTAISTRFNWDRLLRQLSLTLPEDVWFDSFQSTNPAAEGVGSGGAAAVAAATATTVPNTPTSLTITGYGRKQSDIAYLLARLETVPAFSAVQLQSSSRVKIGETWVIQFSVLGALK